MVSMTMNRDDLSRISISEALESTNRRVLVRSTEWYRCQPLWLTLNVISLHFGMVTAGRHVTKVFSMTMNQDAPIQNFISEAVE